MWGWVHLFITLVWSRESGEYFIQKVTLRTVIRGKVQGIWQKNKVPQKHRWHVHMYIQRQMEKLMSGGILSKERTNGQLLHCAYGSWGTLQQTKNFAWFTSCTWKGRMTPIGFVWKCLLHPEIHQNKYISCIAQKPPVSCCKPPKIFVEILIKTFDFLKPCLNPPPKPTKNMSKCIFVENLAFFARSTFKTMLFKDIWTALFPVAFVPFWSPLGLFFWLPDIGFTAELTNTALIFFVVWDRGRDAGGTRGRCRSLCQKKSGFNHDPDVETGVTFAPPVSTPGRDWTPILM